MIMSPNTESKGGQRTHAPREDLFETPVPEVTVPAPPWVPIEYTTPSLKRRRQAQGITQKRCWMHQSKNVCKSGSASRKKGAHRSRQSYHVAAGQKRSRDPMKPKVSRRVRTQTRKKYGELADSLQKDVFVPGAFANSGVRAKHHMLKGMLASI